MLATVVLDIKIVMSALGGLVILLILVSRLYNHPSRPCPNCGRTIRVTSRTCRHCLYELVTFQFRR